MRVVHKGVPWCPGFQSLEVSRHNMRDDSREQEGSLEVSRDVNQGGKSGGGGGDTLEWLEWSQWY